MAAAEQAAPTHQSASDEGPSQPSESNVSSATDGLPSANISSDESPVAVQAIETADPGAEDATNRAPELSDASAADPEPRHPQSHEPEVTT